MPAFKRWIADCYHARALGALQRSLGVETACIVFILALVAWLDMLALHLDEEMAIRPPSVDYAD
jgi:hypothetical protein